AAAAVADAVCSGLPAHDAKMSLFAQLAQLEERYGKLPSILATRADFIDDPHESITLLQEAWRIAFATSDRQNLVFIAGSLAEAYVEDLGDLRNGAKWITRLEDALGDKWEDYEYRQLVELRAKLQAGTDTKRMRPS